MEKEKMFKLEKREKKEKTALEKIEFYLITGLVVLLAGIMVGSISGAVALYNGPDENDVTNLDSSRLVESPTEETDIEVEDEEEEEDYLDSDQALDELIEDSESN